MAAVPSIGRASLVEASGVAPAAAATEGLYERHAAKIHSYCQHRLGSREEAEDAVQTTFMNAFRALGRGIVPEAEAAWLYKIAENVCLSRHRSSRRRGRIESPADLRLVEHVVPAPIAEAEELIGLEDALAAMPAQQRHAILLREWQGLSYREVASELEVSQSAVETLIFRARRSLAQGLEQPGARRRRLRRLLHALDLAPLLGALKTLLAGSAAAKATAAAVAVTAAVSVAGGSTATTAPASPAKPPPPVAVPAKKVLAPAPPTAVRSVPAVEKAARPSEVERAASKAPPVRSTSTGRSPGSARIVPPAAVPPAVVPPVAVPPADRPPADHQPAAGPPPADPPPADRPPAAGPPTDRPPADPPPADRPPAAGPPTDRPPADRPPAAGPPAAVPPVVVPPVAAPPVVVPPVAVPPITVPPGFVPPGLARP